MNENIERLTIGDMTDEQKAQRQKDYNEWVDQLVRENSWTPRKAKRFIQSKSNKILKKFKKQVFNNRNKPKLYVEPPTDLPENFSSESIESGK